MNKALHAAAEQFARECYAEEVSPDDADLASTRRIIAAYLDAERSYLLVPVRGRERS